VIGKTFPALLENAGRAIFETQIRGKIKTGSERSFSLKSDSTEDLFIDWCRELLFYFSVHAFIPCDYDIAVENLSLHAHLRGDTFDATRHHIRIEIKNPTYHDLKIEKDGQGLHARIIFDV
jgi:SHS2 domain-containing protein